MGYFLKNWAIFFFKFLVILQPNQTQSSKIDLCLDVLDFQIELCCRYFGLFWLGHCLGYFLKNWVIFFIWSYKKPSQTQSNKIGFMIVTRFSFLTSYQKLFSSKRILIWTSLFSIMMLAPDRIIQF